MPALFKSGSFTGPTTAITGVGFQPTLVIILAQETTGEGDTQSNIMSIGAGIGPASTDNRAMYFSSDFHGGTVVPASVAGLALDTIVYEVNSANFINAALTLTSLDSDGFTVSVGAGDHTGKVYQYLAFGGTVNAKVGVAARRTTTGTQAVTGVGFQPTVVLFANALNDASFCFGWCDDQLRQGVSANQYEDKVANPTNCNGYQSASKCLAVLDPATGAVSGEADVTSLDADGFTLDWTSAYGTAGDFLYIAIEGLLAEAGTLIQPTSTGQQAITGLSVAPDAVMLMSSNQTAAAGLQANSKFSFGFTDGVTKCGTFRGDLDNVSPIANSRSVRYCTESSVLVAATPNSTSTVSIDAEADVDSLDFDGFTLDWISADATAREVLYLVFGDSIPTIVGSFVAGENTTVLASRAAAFGLDGATNVHDEEGVFKVFGKIKSTEEIEVVDKAHGTGAVSAKALTAGRNSSGNGAASIIKVKERDGTPWFLWVEAGKLRLHSAPPTEDNTTVSHTAGTVVGTQT
jgi:hypothetical protein